MQEQEDDFRRNRDQFTVDLRKENRQSIFKKRRVAQPANLQMKGQDLSQSSFVKLIVDHKNAALIQQIMLSSFSPANLDDLILGLSSDSLEVKHRAAIGLRIVISEVQNFDLMQRVIDAGCVPLLINFMRQQEYPQLQLEATWILTNIACGRTSQCQSIVDKQGLETFIEVIRQNKQYIAQQALWGLGNIAGDSPKFRDAILQKGALEIIIKTIQNTTNMAMLQQGAWVLSNLCRGTPRPKYQNIKTVIPILGRIVMSGTVSQDVIASCLWAISSNSESQKTRIQKVVQIKGFVAHIMEQSVKCTNQKLLIPYLKIVGNISNGNQIHTQQLLKANCLSVFLTLLGHTRTSIRREVCWILSNICVGTPSQLNQILAYTPLIERIATLFHSDEPKVKLEICYVFANICHCSHNENILKMILQYHFLQNLILLIMNQKEAKILVAALNALFQVLQLGRKTGNGQNIIYQRLEQEVNFFEHLQQLQKHNSQEVYKKLIKIFQAYFTIDNSAM